LIGVPDDALRSELLDMRDQDLALRAELAREGSLFQGYHDRMAALHRCHNARLREILITRGWPGRSVAGDDGAAAAWLLLQHAVLDPDLMRQAVPLLERAVDEREADARHLAMLVDRICTLEDRPQVYGTSYDWDPHGALSPTPIGDPENVDERRRRMGLGPIEDNTGRMRAQAAADGEQPPASHSERQREFAAWARAVGWRT
jgi:hypothetical protein